VGQGGLADSRNVLNQQVTTSDQRDNSETHRFWLALNDGFDGTLQPVDALDRVRCKKVTWSLDGLDSSHQ
jgi:hypothetical protein